MQDAPRCHILEVSGLTHKLNSLSSAPVIELPVSHSSFSNKYTKTPLQSAGKYLEAGHCPRISAPNCSPAGFWAQTMFFLNLLSGMWTSSDTVTSPQWTTAITRDTVMKMWNHYIVFATIALLKCWWPGKWWWWPPLSLIGEKICKNRINRKNYKIVSNFFPSFLFLPSLSLYFCLSLTRT